MPGDPFKTTVFFCSKDHQIRIPSDDLKEFFDKLSSLAGVTEFGTSTVMTMKSSSENCGDLTIAKSDFANGTYKIANSVNVSRTIYVTSPTLAYLVGLATPVMNLYRKSDARMIGNDFEKLVTTTAALAEVLGCQDCQLLEGEIFQHPPDGVNMNFFSETICNFRKDFYRQVRVRLNKQ